MAGPDPSRLNSTASSSAPARDEPLELCVVRADGSRQVVDVVLGLGSLGAAEGARRIPRGGSGALATRSAPLP